MGEAVKGHSVASKLKLWLPLCIAAVTFLCYSYTLKNQFTNWDDNLYVDNPYVKNLNADNLKMVLFHNITNNYYHPLTMLSIATNYHFSKTEPFGYYLTNVILHVFNTCLMFYLLLMLLQVMQEKGYGEMKGREWFAAFGALCYGIHPMHVESVSWIAERKDVLYAFFYFSGLITYIKYIGEGKVKWMIYATMLFLLSLLSKPLAVVFPLSAFMMDVLLKRRINAKTILEKTPLILVAIGAGVWAFVAQQKSGAMGFAHSFTLWERIMYSCYGFVMYIFKAFVPANLSAYYPYPSGNPGTIYYLAPFIAVALIGGLLYCAYRAGENYFKVVLFGLGFYFFNVVFVLQFVPSGPTIMADRYTYIAYLGIFFIVVYALQQLWEKRPALHLVLRMVTLGFIGILGYLCYDQTKIWHNTETLFKDVIAKYPMRVDAAYVNLGDFYAEKGDIADAYTNYKILTDKNIANPIVYNNIANIYSQRRQFDSAIASYSVSLQIDSNDFHVYVDRGITYARLKKYDMALNDYNHAFLKDSMAEKLISNRAYTYFMLRQFDNCIKDYTRAIRLNPNKADYYYNRGVAELDIHDYNSTLQDFTKDLQMEPGNLDCVYDMSILYKNMGDYPNALNYAMSAKVAGYKVSDEYISELQQSVNSLSK